MEIETKYSIGDIVYICTEEQLRKCRVASINIEVNKNLRICEVYYVDDVKNNSTFRMSVSQLFDTVDELVKSFNL